MLYYHLVAMSLILTISASAQRSENLPLIVNPQSDLSVEKSTNWTSGDFDGTFQITCGDCNVSITIDFINYVKSLRHSEQDLVLELNDTQSVLIISGARIADPNFVPFENMVVCTAE